MAWPNDNLSDADMNSEQDRPPRAMIRNMLLAVKSIIASRGARLGIASLDTNGHVPATQINGLAMTRAERAKLAGIEAGARADQTASELRAAIGTAGTGLITSAERSKLAGIEAGARADQTGVEIRAALDGLLGTGWRTAASVTDTGITAVVTNKRREGRDLPGEPGSFLELQASITGRTLTLTLVTVYDTTTSGH